MFSVCRQCYQERLEDGCTLPNTLFVKCGAKRLIRTGQLSTGPIQAPKLFIWYTLSLWGVSTVLYVNPFENVSAEFCCLFAIVVFAVSRHNNKKEEKKVRETQRLCKTKQKKRRFFNYSFVINSQFKKVKLTAQYTYKFVQGVLKHLNV